MITDVVDIWEAIFFHLLCVWLIITVSRHVCCNTSCFKNVFIIVESLLFTLDCKFQEL